MPKGGVVFDIGCNIGNHSVFFAKILQAGKIFAFDPQPYCAAVYAKNMKANGITCATFEQMGLGRAAMRANVSRFVETNYGATRFATADEGDFAIDSLDNYCAAAKIKAIDFIKIDVEGMALDVIDGAAKTLAKHRPPLWVELIPRFGEIEPARAALAELGYDMAFRMTRTDYMFHHKDRPIAGL